MSFLITEVLHQFVCWDLKLLPSMYKQLIYAITNWKPVPNMNIIPTLSETFSCLYELYGTGNLIQN